MAVILWTDLGMIVEWMWHSRLTQNMSFAACHGLILGGGWVMLPGSPLFAYSCQINTS